MLLDIWVFALFTLLVWSFLVTFFLTPSVLSLYTGKYRLYNFGLFVTKKRPFFLHFQKLSYVSSQTLGMTCPTLNFWLFLQIFDGDTFNDFWVSRFFSYVLLWPNRNIWFFRWFWGDFVLRICQSVVFFRCFLTFFFSIFLLFWVFLQAKKLKKKN